MATDALRRKLLAALTGGGLLATCPALARAARPATEAASPALLSCWSDSPTRPRWFRAGRVDAPGVALELPARGHDIAWHPAADGSAVVVARRPGTFLVRWQVASGTELARFETDDESRFEGHLAFSADAHMLYATETDLITGEGRIGVFDALDLTRVDAWSCGGIGPHAVKRMHDGRLAVANGGILTLPETGRIKRNLDSMDPSLSFIDPRSGRLLAQHRLPDAFMSVRHIAQSRSGQVAVSLQNEGGQARPLFALLDGDRLRYGDADASLMARCGRYAGDITAIGERFAVSCTSAGITALWSADGRPGAALATPRVCALSPHHGRLLASAESGDIWQFAIDDGARNDGGAFSATTPMPRMTHHKLAVMLDNHACSAMPPAG